MTDEALTVRPPVARRVLALVTTSHPGPSLAIAVMTALLAAQAAPHGTRPLLAAVPMLAGQLSVGWSNDAFDAGRDAAAGRTDKPLATGAISARAVWTAALVGLGTHFANVLPDLDADRGTGVRGLPQQVAARWGSRAVRAVALVLLLTASVLMVLTARPERRWVAIAGLGVSVVVAAIGARGSGKVPFVSAIAIAAIDAVLVAAGVVPIQRP